MIDRDRNRPMREGNKPPTLGPAPADARLYDPWPWWKRMIAYGALGGLALLCIWYIDRQVMRAGPATILAPGGPT